MINKFEDHLRQAELFYEVGTKAKIDVTIAKYNLSDANLNLIRVCFCIILPLDII